MEKEMVALLEDKDALEVLRKRFNVKEDRFPFGVTFVQKIMDGMSKNKAYVETFGCTIDVAKKTSSQFHRSKWVQELIKYLRPDEDSLYFGETKAIIGRGMQIVNDPRSTPREITEAMKALQPYIKAEKQRIEVEVDLNVTTGASVVSTLNDKIAALVSQGKMIAANGEIIDVAVIE